jgi:hypothetical protein
MGDPSIPGTVKSVKTPTKLLFRIAENVDVYAASTVLQAEDKSDDELVDVNKYFGHQDTDSTFAPMGIQ